MRWQPVSDEYVAFDTLETNTLITSLEECGVEKPLKDWFRDYLTSRSYRVKISDTFSDEKIVRCGVPQGSGSGPVCYLMHVNSLCNVLQHCSAHMFADDLCALRAGTDIAETCRLVQQDVDAVVKWSHDNGIVLNSEKQYLIIHSPYSPLKETPLPIYTHTDLRKDGSSGVVLPCYPGLTLNAVVVTGDRR
ncbi:hypothetical protein SFRURICE_007578 [Spodoptera frugiperda]|nr:hypothetical protein SFRURICE_007578 [Spodoptera frugiperda]